MNTTIRNLVVALPLAAAALVMTPGSRWPTTARSSSCRRRTVTRRDR